MSKLLNIYSCDGHSGCNVNSEVNEIVSEINESFKTTSIIKEI